MLKKAAPVVGAVRGRGLGTGETGALASTVLSSIAEARPLCYGVGMGKRTQIGYLDGEKFIATMERASEEGDADFASANMPRLETLIGQLQDRAYELAELQGRARAVRDRHEHGAG